MVLGMTLLYPSGGQGAEAVKLPLPVKTGGMPLAEALQNRCFLWHGTNRSLNLAKPGHFSGPRTASTNLGPRQLHFWAALFLLQASTR
jgi:hypothetical protein